MAGDDRIKMIGCAAAVLLAMMLAIIGLWLFGHKSEALFLLGAMLIVITVIVASAWAAYLVSLGSKIALAAQVSDDQRDQALLEAVADITKSMVQQQGNQLTLPPMPSQNWLPRLTEWSEGQFREVGEGDGA